MPNAGRPVLALVGGVAIGWLVFVLALAPLRVQGESMLPFLADGDVVIVLRPGLDRLLGGSGGERQGDVVALVDPRQGAALVKRVVASRGATVEIAAGAVSVDSSPASWGDPGMRGSDSLAPTQVPPGAVYVLGDNRMPLASRDSRAFGPVPVESLRGRVIAVLRLR